MTVVERLAAALGFADEEERVAAYYHRMEHGQLPAEGSRRRCSRRLAAILGSSAAALRRAG